MTPPVVSPERGAVAPDVLPFWGADHTAPHKEHLTEAGKKHLDISMFCTNHAKGFIRLKQVFDFLTHLLNSI